jgi:hypothetical protein
MRGMIPTVVSAGIGAVSIDLVPALITKFLPFMGSGLMVYVTKGATVYGGYQITKRIAGQNAAIGFVAGAGAKILYDLAAGPIMSLLAPTPAPTSGFGAYLPPASMGAYLPPSTMGEYGAATVDANPYGEGMF